MTKQYRLLMTSVVAGMVGWTSAAHAAPVDKALFDGLKQGLVTHVCSDGGKWLECFRLSASKCPEIAKQFVDPCIDRMAKEFPTDDSEKAQLAWGQKLAGCFNSIFASRYGSSHLNTPECKEPPPHLR
jgi:hypothetical protein